MPFNMTTLGWGGGEIPRARLTTWPLATRHGLLVVPAGGAAEVETVKGLLGDFLDLALELSMEDQVARTVEFVRKWGALWYESDQERVIRGAEKVMEVAEMFGIGAVFDPSSAHLSHLRERVEEPRYGRTTPGVISVREYRKLAVEVLCHLRASATPLEPLTEDWILDHIEDEGAMWQMRCGITEVEISEEIIERYGLPTATRGKLWQTHAHLQSFEEGPLADAVPDSPIGIGMVYGVSYQDLINRMRARLISMLLNLRGGLDTVSDPERNFSINFEARSAGAVVAMQLVELLSRAATPTICSGRECGVLFVPTRKPTKGRKSYCPRCKDLGEPQRQASSAYRSRR